MGGTIVAVIAAFAVFIILWFLLSRRNKQEDTPATFVCTECGEKDCNCYREDEIPKNR
jgi:hypothetical protein